MIMDVKYKCDGCGEPFFSLDSLQTHHAVHSVDGNRLKNKPENLPKDIVYECNECEAIFYNVLSLQCHKSVHSVEEHSSSSQGYSTMEEPFNLNRSKGNFKKEFKNEAVEECKDDDVISGSQLCKSKPICKNLKNDKSMHKNVGSIGEKLEETTHDKHGFFKSLNSFQKFSLHDLQPCIQSSKVDKVTCNPGNLKKIKISKLFPNVKSKDKRKKLMTSKANPNQKIYKCDVCGKIFSQNGTRTRHMRIHTGDKSYQCDICGKSFSRNQYLQVHLRTHSGEKPYQCDICHKKCLDRSHLNTHMRTHTGEKPYKCDVCEKLFLQNTDLTRHMRIHTGEKPFKCDLCQKCFSQSSSLKKHKRIHTGEQS